MNKRALMELLQASPDDVAFFVHAATKGKSAQRWEEAAVLIDRPGVIRFIPASTMEVPEVE